MAKVDELNRLYNSRDPNDIIKFYDHFNTPEELIEWSRNRQHGRTKIYTVKGDTDIVVVIPTANRHGEYAKNCEKEIFKGQQIVFVESGGRGDPYFNYARNTNIGLKYALRYKPKWVILSNDDVYKIDNFSILKESLTKINNELYDTVYIKPDPGFYHSDLVGVLKMPKLFKRLKTFLSKNAQDRLTERLRLKLIKKFNITYQVRSKEKPYKNKFFSFLNRLEYKPIEEWRNLGDFAIFSPVVLKNAKGKPFDEIFINGGEDYDLGKRLFDSHKHISINFRIGSVGGGTFRRQPQKLGAKTLIRSPKVDNQKSNARKLQDVFNILYFDYKYKQTQKDN